MVEGKQAQQEKNMDFEIIRSEQYQSQSVVYNTPKVFPCTAQQGLKQLRNASSKPGKRTAKIQHAQTAKLRTTHAILRGP